MFYNTNINHSSEKPMNQWNGSIAKALRWQLLYHCIIRKWSLT